MRIQDELRSLESEVRQLSRKQQSVSA